MTIPTRSEHGGFRLSLILTLLVTGAAAMTIYGVGGWRSGRLDLASILDKTGPVLSVPTKPRGLGLDPVPLSVDVVDADTTIRQITISMRQNELVVPLERKSFDGTEPRKISIPLTIDAKKSGLKEGDVTIVLEAGDGSFWENGSRSEFSLPVSYTRPRIEVLTTQQNSTVGGAEIVVFRVIGRAMERGGVEIAKQLYPAAALPSFDPALSGADKLYYTLFPIPLDFDPAKMQPRVTIEDDFGAVANSGFNYRIKEKKFPTVEMKLGEQFVQQKVPELLDVLKRTDPGVTPSGDLYRDFKLVNETLRSLNEAVIQRSIKESPVTERLWRGAFIRPLAAAPKAGFAEHRLYKHEGTTVSESKHMGIDLADVLQAAVRAANRGQVVFAEELGIYGNAIIIDHGGGVSSLYGHLSSISVRTGDTVESGQEIGRTGMTGLAGGDHLHFEIRVHGMPVSPFEWWDPSWVKLHVEEKIALVLPPVEKQP